MVTTLHNHHRASSPGLRVRLVPGVVAVALLLMLAACNPQVETPEANADQAAASSTGSTNTTLTGSNLTPAATPVVAPLDPLPQAQTQVPVRLQIPAIGLDLPVTEMGWQVTLVNGERTTTWVVPEDSLGWHANSAGTGAAGNTIISGRQVGPDAPLAALAIGEIEVGQDVLLTDADGLVFLYRIAQISEPIALAGASQQDEARAAAYFDPTDLPRLTLVTGWPEFTTTHRIFALGDFVGVVP